VSSEFPSDHPSDFPPSERPRYTSRELSLQKQYPKRTMYRGDSFVFDFQIQRPPTGSPDGTPPQPVNLTGYLIWFAVKYHLGDPDNQAIAFLGIGTGVTITDVVNGKGEAIVTPIKTRGFPDGVSKLFYGLKVQDPSGNEFTAEVGTIDVWPSAIALI